VVGSVRSATEATILAESSGRVTGVYASLGAYVSQGQTIAELENASQRATLLQAQGALDAALASASKVSGGTREEQRAILETQLQSAEASLETTRTNSVTSILSAYAAVEDAVRGKTDSLFDNPTSNPVLLINTSDSALEIKVENTRRAIETLRLEEQIRRNSLETGDDLQTELKRAESELRTVKGYLDMVVDALNKAIPTSSYSKTTIDGYRASAEAARGSVTASLSSVTAASEALSGRVAARDIAKKNLEQGISGGQKEDVSVAEASVTQARAGLRAAEANLARTLIRAPFSGTVNSLGLDLGEYVTIGTPAVTIANNTLLEVRTAVTESDLAYIQTGADVLINDRFKGTITSKAPALDPFTKKAEIRIAITDPSLSITNGQSVQISIPRVKNETDISSVPTIPLSALKFTPDGAVVFTLSKDMKLVAHLVEPGTLFGDVIEIRSGLTPEMNIVSDARGLREGDTVSIAE
jgi:RND family efflux transporter MFP subunit